MLVFFKCLVTVTYTENYRKVDLICFLNSRFYETNLGNELYVIDVDVQFRALEGILMPWYS